MRVKCTVWKNVKTRNSLLQKKKFREINSLVISRNFCQKSVRENFRNFHTVNSALFSLALRINTIVHFSWNQLIAKNKLVWRRICIVSLSIAWDPDSSAVLYSSFLKLSKLPTKQSLIFSHLIWRKKYNHFIGKKEKIQNLSSMKVPYHFVANTQFWIKFQ